MAAHLDKKNTSQIIENECYEIDIENIPVKMLRNTAMVTTTNGYYVIEETPDFYTSFTRKFIIKRRTALDHSWIYGLSNFKKENEQKYYFCHNQHFYAYIDRTWVREGFHCNVRENKKSQWGGHKDTDCTHYVVTAFVSAKKYKDELMTLRDIRGNKHHKMLYELKKKVLKKTKSVYGIKESDLIMFVRFMPRFYLLKIQFVHKQHPDKNLNKYRDHYLNDILKNIEKDSNYYRDAKIPNQIFFDLKNPHFHNSFYQHLRPLMQKKFNFYKTKPGIWRPHNHKTVNKINYGKSTQIDDDAVLWRNNQNDDGKESEPKSVKPALSSTSNGFKARRRAQKSTDTESIKSQIN
eukprot:462879_1